MEIVEGLEWHFRCFGPQKTGQLRSPRCQLVRQWLQTLHFQELISIILDVAWAMPRRGGHTGGRVDRPQRPRTRPGFCRPDHLTERRTNSGPEGDQREPGLAVSWGEPAVHSFCDNQWAYRNKARKVRSGRSASGNTRGSEAASRGSKWKASAVWVNFMFHAQIALQRHVMETRTTSSVQELRA